MSKIVKIFLIIPIIALILCSLVFAGNSLFSPPRLSKLSVDDAKISPYFSSKVSEYTVTVPYETETVQINTKARKDTDVLVEGNENLSVGENICTVSLINKSGKENTYTIKINRSPSNESRLKNLQVEGYKMEPEFSSDVFVYKLKVDSLTSNLNLIVTPMNEDTAVSFPRGEYLKPGENICTIDTTSQSGKYNSKYTLYVEKETVRPTAQELVKRGGKFCALTFDDGPCQLVPKLLDILEKHSTTSTFFVVGNRISSFENELKQCASKGHEIANHSWDHSFMGSGWSTNACLENIKKCSQEINRVTGQTPKFFRPPGGMWGKGEKIGDMSVVFWTVDTRDWETKNKDKIVSEIKASVHDGAIILMHDLYDSTLEAVDTVIPYLKSQGYTFVTVSELMEINRLR